MVDLARSQGTAHRLITRWGKGSTTLLNRNGVKRACFAARAEYAPKERGLYLDGSERFFISTIGLATPPDFELDTIEWRGKGETSFTTFKMIVPPVGPRPNGLVIFYDCNVLRIGPTP